jgi:hypothetical protein
VRPVPTDVACGKNATIRQAERWFEMNVAKEEARKLIDLLPDHATWDDIMYEFYVKKKLAKALDEADAGDVVSHQRAKQQILSK